LKCYKIVTILRAFVGRDGTPLPSVDSKNLCGVVCANSSLRRARMLAASEGTSVSAMVRNFLNRQSSGEDEREDRRIAALDEIYELAATRGKARRKPLKPLTRDDIYAERVR